MPEANGDCAQQTRPHTTRTGTERRLHPRWATDGADGSAAAGPPTREAPE